MAGTGEYWNLCHFIEWLCVIEGKNENKNITFAVHIKYHQIIPERPLFLEVGPPKEDLFQSKQWSFNLFLGIHIEASVIFLTIICVLRTNPFESVPILSDIFKQLSELLLSRFGDFPTFSSTMFRLIFWKHPGKTKMDTQNDGFRKR